MMRGTPLLLIAALGACAGRSLTSSGSATSPAPASDVFACLRKEIKAVGFTQTSYDEAELRVNAHKYDENARRPNTQFRRLVDRLAFDVGTAVPGTETAVVAQASTFAQLATQRGPAEEQERTSEGAKEAARAILARCATQP